MASEYHCPHCGTRVDTDPDICGGERQEYIEDCPICCHSNRLRVTLRLAENDFAVEAFVDE
jgi:hypothetical protein